MAKKRTEEEWENHRFPLESKLQEYVMQRLRGIPNLVPIKISDRYISGISDILLCVEGRFVAIELKIEGNKPSRLQLEFLKNIKDAGGVSGVAYTWGEVKDVLREVIDL